MCIRDRYYIIYQVFDSTYKQLTIQENERLMSAQVSFLQTQYEIQGNHLKKEEVQRHDLRHLLAGIRTLLETGKTGDALDMLNQYVHSADPVSYTHLDVYKRQVPRYG